LPFENNTFDKALAINSMQIWPDAVGGLQEMRRVMRSDGQVALGFTPYSGQPSIGLIETLFEDWYITREQRAARNKSIKELAEKKDAERKGTASDTRPA